jgi:hypothetical protein
MANNNEVLSSKIKLFKAPTAYIANYQQPTGSRFGADAIFNGDNKEYGARIMFYFTKNETETNEELTEDKALLKTGAHKDSIYLKIYDKDRLIRNLKRKVPDSTGVYKWRWFMDEAGFGRPSRETRTITNEPGGTIVKPGVYNLVISHQNQKSMNTIEVKSDPRIKFSETSINDAYEAKKEIEKLIQTVNTAVNQLIDSKNIAASFKNRLTEKDKTTYKHQIKLCEEITKKVDSLIDLYLGKVDKRQGITKSSDVSVMQRIGTANWYASSRPNGLTTTEKTLINQSKMRLEEVLVATNKFFALDWLNYQTELEKINLSPFKEIKIFKTN